MARILSVTLKTGMELLRCTKLRAFYLVGLATFFPIISAASIFLHKSGFNSASQLEPCSSLNPTGKKGQDLSHLWILTKCLQGL